MGAGGGDPGIWTTLLGRQKVRTKLNSAGLMLQGMISGAVSCRTEIKRGETTGEAAPRLDN